MYTLICAGGTSAKVLEALLHFYAAGHGPRTPYGEAMRVLVIDPDRANGNGRRVSRLAELYATLHGRLAGRLGPGADGRALRLFGTRLDLMGPGLQVWRPAGLRDTLRDSIDYARLAGDWGVFEDVAALLITRTSLDLPLQVGFRGRPAIGAAAMSLVSRAASESPWADVIRGIKSDIAERGGARVFVVGSVFGGTGASAIHPIVRFLRSSVGGDRQQLRIGVGALVPYFTFVDRDDNLTAKSRFFPLATRAAVEFYQHLRENKDWDFDAMHWAGDSDPMRVETAEGGDRQENRAHYCELLMALTCIDFFNNDVGSGRCHYAGPRQPSEVPDASPADWTDMPRFGTEAGDPRRDATRLFVMGMAHHAFCGGLLSGERIDREPYCVPWYVEQFRDGSLRETDRQGLETLDVYCRDHLLRWWREVLESHQAWFFNRAALEGDGGLGVNLRVLPNLRLANDLKKRVEHFNEFFEDLVDAGAAAAGERGLARYVALLAHAAEAYLERHYRADLQPASRRS